MRPVLLKPGRSLPIGNLVFCSPLAVGAAKSVGWEVRHVGVVEVRLLVTLHSPLLPLSGASIVLARELIDNMVMHRC